MMNPADNLLAQQLLAQGLLSPEALAACTLALTEAKQAGEPQQPLAQMLLRKRLLPAWQLGQLLLELQSSADDTRHQESPPDLDADAPSDALPTNLGRYPVTGLLGSGGMGDVLSVRDQHLGREIAAKVIRGSFSAIIRARFIQEAQITGMLQHPNIVPLHELGMTDSGRIYFTMKCIEGDDLVQVLLERPLFELLQILLKVCDAMAFAHSQGVIHRDLKPANIMVGRFGEVQVMDWGLAKVVGEPDLAACLPAREQDSGRGSAEDSSIREVLSPDGPKTLTGTILGTCCYMAPEQARGDISRLDRRTDVYALGAMLYEILAGCPPYLAKTADEAIKLMLAGQLIPPSQLNRGRQVPHELEAVTLKAMALRPADRYDSVGALQRDIEAYLMGRQVGAARYRFRELLWMSLRRHQLAAAVLGSILVVALIALGYNMRQQQLKVAKARGEVEGHQLATLLSAVDRALEGIPADPLKRRQPNMSERQRQAQLIGRLLRLAESQAQLSQLSPTPTTRRAHFRTLLRLGRLAEVGGDFALAESALRHAAGLGLDAGTVTSHLERLGKARKAQHVRTRNAIDALLASARGGKLATEDAFRGALMRLSSYRERQTVETLLSELARLTDNLRQATQQALLATCREDVRRPDLQRALEAWQSPPTSSNKPRATNQQLRIVQTALKRLVDKAHRQDPQATKPSWRLLLAHAQKDALQHDGREDQVLELICGALGYLGEPEGAIQGLTRYLYTEWDELRALNAGLALARLSPEAPEAKRVLMRLVDMGQEGPDPRWTINSMWWRRIQRELLKRPAWPARLVSGKSKVVSDATQQPSTARAFYNRGLQRDSLGDRTGAIADFTRAIELEPNYAPSYVNRGCSRNAAGDRRGARADYDQAIKLAPNLAEAYANRGMLRKSDGDLTGALSDLSRAIKINPRNAPFHSNQGQLHRAMGRLTEAIADFDRALELDPKFAPTYVNRGLAHQATGDLKRATRDFTQAIKIDPSLAIAYNARGNARRRSGDLVAAMADLEQAIKLDRGYAEAHLNRGVVRQMTHDLPGAIADYDRAITIAPSIALAFKLRGNARRSAGDLKRAVADLNQAIRLDPELATAYNDRGSLHMSQSKFSAAKADFSKAIELNPKLWQAWANRGVVLCRTNKRTEGLRSLRQALSLAPGQFRPRIAADIKRIQSQR